MNYSTYSVAITNEPSYYGTECTQVDADRIAETLAQMIQAEFPGIAVNTNGTKTTGPDSAVIDEINEFVSENWTKAL